MFADIARGIDADDFGKYILEQLQFNPQDKPVIEKYLLPYYKKMVSWSDGCHSTKIEHEVLSYFK